jgi:hypothetical protein
VALNLLHLDEWVGNREVGVPIDNPTWTDVLTALSELNGETRTLLSLEEAGGAALQVGGGPSSFIVQYLEGGACWCVTSESSAGGVVQLVAGGQAGEYPADLCVSSSQAREAAESFFASGTRAPILRWRKTA